MSIYDPLAQALGIEPNPNLKDDIYLFIPNEINAKINSEEALRRNAEIVVCDRCGIKGNRPNMMRWHFENCKTKLRTCKHCLSYIPRQNIKPIIYDKKHYCNRACYMESKKGKVPITMTDEVRFKISEAAILQSEQRSERAKHNKIWMKSGRWKTK